MKKRSRCEVRYAIWKLIGNEWHDWAGEFKSSRDAWTACTKQYGFGFTVMRVTIERMAAPGKTPRSSR